MEGKRENPYLVYDPFFDDKKGKCPQCGVNELRQEDELGLCLSCEKENSHDTTRINSLQKDGHTYHCANRIVYGDGECECDLIKTAAKPDKFHYHEFIHTVNMITEMVDSHLSDHHIGGKYGPEITEIQTRLSELYNKVSNDSDELFKDK
jgi:hypothetical protein